MVKTNSVHTTCESRASDVSQEHQTPGRQSTTCESRVSDVSQEHHLTHQTPDRQSTLPKTTCLLSSHSVLLHVTKNWHPLELGPGYMQV